MPRGSPVYVGDTDEKSAYFDEAGLATLGVRTEAHGKIPDVIMYHQWESEVWIAESPSHLIHFNGERFLGPHNETDEET